MGFSSKTFSNPGGAFAGGAGTQVERAFAGGEGTLLESNYPSEGPHHYVSYAFTR